MVLFTSNQNKYIMNNLKVFDLNIITLVWRFYLMMGVMVIAGFSGYWLIALLALPIFFSIIMGISFTKNEEEISSELKSAKYTSLSSTSKVDLLNFT
jgi:hypothetical protein